MPNEKILVVDDDTNICELLRLYLEKEGYVVKIVNDGVSAINAFKQENPDLTPGRYAVKSENSRTSR